MAETNKKVRALQLEVQPLEAFNVAGCGTSSTHPRCTCPIFPPTTGLLFTAKASG